MLKSSKNYKIRFKNIRDYNYTTFQSQFNGKYNLFLLNSFARTLSSKKQQDQLSIPNNKSSILKTSQMLSLWNRMPQLIHRLYLFPNRIINRKRPLSLAAAIHLDLFSEFLYNICKSSKPITEAIWNRTERMIYLKKILLWITGTVIDNMWEEQRY